MHDEKQAIIVTEVNENPYLIKFDIKEIKK